MVICISTGLIFCCGYVVGRLQAPQSVPREEKISTVASPQVVVPDSHKRESKREKLRQEIIDKKAVHNGVLGLYLKERLRLQDKLNEIMRMNEYLRQQAEQADETTSLEASLVHEARYRNGLQLLSSAEQALIVLYEKILQAYKEYTDYLEAAALKRE
jgi:hypothetical protein